MTVAPNPVHQPIADLEIRMAHLLEAPRDGGVVELIVIRPAKEQRTMLDTVWLGPEDGAQGHAWAKGCWKSLPEQTLRDRFDN